MKSYLISVAMMAWLATTCLGADPLAFPSEPAVGMLNHTPGAASLLACAVAVRVDAAGLSLHKAAEIKALPLPTFPAELLNAGVVGGCDVVFDITDGGSVINARASQRTHGEFAEPSVAAVSQWKFEPLEQTSRNKTATATAHFVFMIYQ